MTDNSLTAYGMGNYGDPVMTYPTELEACRDQINTGVNTSGWPPLGEVG